MVLLVGSEAAVLNKVDEPKSFADIEGRMRFLRTPHAKELLALMPKDIRKKFIRCYKNIKLEDVTEAKKPDLVAVIDWFQENSEISRIVKRNPASSETFPPLYRKAKPTCPVDEYFPKGEAAIRIYERLQAIKAFNQHLYTRMLETREKLEILSLCSGINYGCIEAIAALPRDLQKRIHLVNVDIDPWVIKEGQKFLASLNISARIEYIQADIRKFADHLNDPGWFKEQGIIIPADVIDLVGVVCTAPSQKKESIFFLLYFLLAENGVIMPSIPMHPMIKGDPLTDFVMRFTTWHMVYETKASIREIIEKVGLKWHEEYEGLPGFFTDGKDNHIMPLLTKN